MWIRTFSRWNHWIKRVGMSGICGSGCLIVGIIRLLGIRIEYLIVGMIGLCGSGYSIVGIVVLGRFKMNI